MDNFFSENNYKYGTESFVGVYLKNYQFVLADDLKKYEETQETFNSENPCNLYFILRRSKVTLDPESVKIAENKVSLDLLIKIRDQYNKVSLGLEFTDIKRKLTVKSIYPYNFFSVFDGENHLFTAKAGALIDEIDRKNIPGLEFEVVYVGQSYGANGNTTPLDRLLSHETLQRILSDTSHNHPDCDVWIMFANFSQTSMLAMAGNGLIKRSAEPDASEYEKAISFFEENQICIPRKQVINFTEAALINYFKPTFNNDFKERFPSPKHKSYSECYKMDIRSLWIEIDLPEKYLLFTRTVSPKHRHFGTFEFNLSDQRYNIPSLVHQILSQDD